MKQQTIRKEISISGIGLHSGQNITVKIRPAEAGSGIVLIRTDLPGEPRIEAIPGNVSGTARGTSIGHVHTVEHLLSALYALSISNLEVALDGPELPAMDGSAKYYYEALKGAGTIGQNKEIKTVTLKKAISLINNGCSITAIPSDRFIISFMIDFSLGFIGPQFFRFEMSSKGYSAEIAPARTFGFMEEISGLKAQGLAKGATTENAIAIGKDGYITPLRFNDELVRHKILDLIGDLSLAGAEIKAHIIAVRSGHMLNIELAKALHRVQQV